MLPRLSVDEFLADLQRVVSGHYAGKPLFFWEGGANRLNDVLSSDLATGLRVYWLDVNELAEDVIPRRARETFQGKLRERIDEAIANGGRVLVVTNPYLILRYEPSAPFAPFWNRFANSQRATVIALPRSVPRPPALPSYIQFRGDSIEPSVIESIDGAAIVRGGGGNEPC